MDGSSRSGQVPLRVAEGLLALALLFSALAFGAVQTWSQAVAAALVAAAALAAAWARPRGVAWPVICGAAVAFVVGVQALPLPRALVGTLSPSGLALVELAVGRVGRHALSLDPAGTARELGRLLSYALCAFTASRLSADTGRARRLTLLCGGLVVVQCALIAVHKIVATDMIYGLHTPAQNNHVLASFGNANFLAGYLTLGVPSLVALGAVEEDRGPRTAWLALAGLAAAMILLTASRSGLGGLLAALVVVLVALRRPLASSRTLLVGAGGGLAALLAGTLALDRTRLAKLAALFDGSALAADLKVRSWRDAPALIADYWRTGVGRGAFETVFPGYKHVVEALTFTHLEDAPLQLLADFGVPVGLAVMGLWIAAVGVGLARPLRHAWPGEDDVYRIGAGAALAGISIHELGDFSLDMASAVGLLAATQMGLLWPAPRLHTDGSAPLDRLLSLRPVRLGAVAVAIGVGATGLGYGAHYDIAHEVARINTAVADNAPGGVEPMVRAAIGRHPGEPWLPFVAGVDRVRHGHPGAALPYLNRALILDPSSWRPHFVLGEALLGLGRPSQALLELRLAYVGSGFGDTVPAALAQRTDLRRDEVLEALAPGGAPVLRAWAGYLDRTQRDDDLAAVAARLVAVAPGDLVGERLLARLEIRRKHFEAALAHARKLPAGDPEAVLLQVQALDGLGRALDSDVLLAEADRRGGSQPLAEPVARLLAERALAEHRADTALAILDRANQDDLEPLQLARLHLLRAEAYEAQGKIREAIRDSEQAARIHPAEETWLQLGALYERVGLQREALLVYRGAVRSTPAPSAALKERLARSELLFRIPTLTGGSGPDRPEAPWFHDDDSESDKAAAADDDEAKPGE